MALQAPERRNRTLQEDLERAFALSRADKRLGEYFPPLENSSHAWHYDGTEHSGGGFDSDMYAFRNRSQLKQDYEVSVVQWARERDGADKGWHAEQTARTAALRNEDRQMKTIWAPEEADILDAKKNVEDAWAREQRERDGLGAFSPAKGKSRATYEPPITVDARRLNESYQAPRLGEDDPGSRTKAWLGGRGEMPGVRDYTMDPTEQNELHTMDVYEEELRRRKRGHRTSSSRSSASERQISPVRVQRRPSGISSSKPPSLPEKESLDEEPEYLESPKSTQMTMSRAPPSRVSTSRVPTSRPRSRVSLVSDVSSDQTERPARTNSIISVTTETPTEERSIPPSLPSKSSRRGGSPDSMATESRQSARSMIDDDDDDYPEAIEILSPVNNDQESTRVRSRPPSSVSRRIESLMEDKEPLAKERPLSFHVLTSESRVDLKTLKSSISLNKVEPKFSLKKFDPEEDHVISSSSSWQNVPPPDDEDIRYEEPPYERTPIQKISYEMPPSERISYDKPPSEKIPYGKTPNQRVSFDKTSYEKIPREEKSTTCLRGNSEPSAATLIGQDRMISPAAQIAQSFRQMALEASADPTNSVYLRDMSFTVPAMFSRSTVNSHEVVQDEPEEVLSQMSVDRTEDEEIIEEPPTPKQKRSSIPQPPPVMAQAPVSRRSSRRSTKPRPNIDKSLPGTPYTMTHSVVSTPEFDADALEAAQQTADSYYRGERESMPPEYSSGTKTPRESLRKSYRDSFASSKAPQKSMDSLRSAKTQSTGAMGDAEPEEVNTFRRDAERRPSKRSTKKRPKPEGSQASSDGSGSTVKASVHARSESSISEDGRNTRTRQERYEERVGTERGHSLRRTKVQLPPGTSHTRVSYSDSESTQEDLPIHIPEETQERSVESSPISVRTTEEEDGVQFVMVPESQEPRSAGGRMSGHTFGLPTGTNMTFHDSVDWRASDVPQEVPNDPRDRRASNLSQEIRNDSRDWRASHTSQEVRNDSRVSLQSRPQSMAPSTTSNRTRASTLRASLRTPLPDISERDTASELSFRGDERQDSGSFGINNDLGTGPSEEEAIRVDAPDAPMDRFGMGPGWRADLMGVVAWDTGSTSKSISDQSKPLRRFSGMHPPGFAAGPSENRSKEDLQSSSSSLGEELRDNYTLPHHPESYHGSQHNSLGLGFSSGVEENNPPSNQGQGSSGNSRPPQYNVGEVVEWNEDTEVGMAGVGAHGIRSKVSYKEPPPPESSDGFTD
ncbi:hypothetical protein CPB86DRAFT_805024 [Serendipita vermifera]|nr:hypothetical protein CPB86DRAFT_805024 [Serendipita vermifera]